MCFKTDDLNTLYTNVQNMYLYTFSLQRYIF